MLFTALAVGNPFLACGRDAKVGVAGPAISKPATLDSGREAAFAIERGQQANPNPGFVLTSGRAGGAAIVPASLQASGGGIFPLPKCPDAALAPLVVDVENVAGEVVWVLRDGRRLRRNRDAGEPMLVPASSLDK